MPQQAAPGEGRQTLAPPVSAIDKKDIATWGHPLFQVCAMDKGGYREKLHGKAQVKSYGQTPKNMDG